MNDRGTTPLLDRVLGVSDAPDEEVEALLARMQPIRKAVEDRVSELLSKSRSALDAFPPDARTLFSGAIDLLVGRTK
jgi:hypothetical protein